MNASTTSSTLGSVEARPITPWKAILWGGLLAGLLDAVDGVIAFGTQGLNPVQVLQYIASGLLGRKSFEGGLATAALGAALHFFIAFVVALVYVLVARRLSALKKEPIVFGALYGMAVYFFMNYLVLPLSAVGPSALKLGLFLNGVIGHALFVGVPIAYFARKVQ